MKVAMITGAGSGIGKAVALKLIANGYSAVLTGRSLKKLEQVAAQSGSDNVLCVSADVTSPDDVDRLFTEARNHFNRVDLLFNNAGISAPATEIDELDPQVWQDVINTNLSGSFYCARKAYEQMRQQTPCGGRIINNGSISAHAPRPYSVPYTVSKHAITGLTRCLALDGRQHNIACGQIDIGNAVSEMAASLGEGALQPNGEMIAEPLMDVEHVASSVLHMAELPLDANVLFMTVMASSMPFVGRG